MSRVSIRHGAVVKCDLVTVRETPLSVFFENPCKETFTTYSIAGLARSQAAKDGWARVKAGKVKWPGMPIAAPSKKVDLCAGHASLVMSDEEYKIHKKAQRAALKTETELAKVKKPRKPRKPKTEASAEVTGG
jgi:hypothetical protein